jgi:hypothetical protein
VARVMLGQGFGICCPGVVLGQGFGMRSSARYRDVAKLGTTRGLECLGFTTTKCEISLFSLSDFRLAHAPSALPCLHPHRRDSVAG